MKINWNESSTKRGLVWAIFGLIGLFLILMGRKEDIAVLSTFAGAVAGGMGIALPDKKE